jgi:cytochrome c-type biogenesis protein CcmF
MNPGDLLLRLSLALVAGSSLVFLGPVLGRWRARGGAALFGLHAALLVAALALLASYFVAHRFEYSYVAQYSSRALSPALTLAALWAGQEGSILLWAALGALVGVFLLVQPGSLRTPAMFFVSLFQLLMMWLLLVKSPFAHGAVVPADGQGLNPLLEDPWMVIHPPVLFVGYAAMMVPFALAAAALARRDYREWNRMTWPWTLFSVVTLGAGIALGGIWAYKTLGWGGYWGWDPVENASLIPWLLAVALLHGLMIQRTLGALTRTNLIVALLGWITVVGGTYLTRSGVLQDFSVHSFADSGLNTPLLSVLAGTTVLAVALLGARWRALPGNAANWVNVSRESALWLGLMTMLAFAVLVAVGTTAPITTALAGKPAGVQPTFYQGIAVPLGLAVLILMALAPALRWTRQQGLSWISLLPPGLIAGVIAIAIAVPLGMRDGMWLSIVFATGLALGINAWMAARLFRRGWMFGAGYLGHTGVAIMALGIAVSTAMGHSERLVLPAGQAVQSSDYRLTFTGQKTDARGAQHLDIHVEGKNLAFDAKPRLMESPRGDGMIRTPAIEGWREIYLSPLELRHERPTGEDRVLWLRKGEEKTVGGIGFTFLGFRMDNHERLIVYADLDVRQDELEFHASPAVSAGQDGSHPIPARVPGLGEIQIARVDADNGSVAITLPAESIPATAVAVVDFSTKPLVNLVWIGALITLIGSGLAGIRRAAERAVDRGRPGPAAAAGA